MKPLKVVYSYARKDKKLREKLQAHLRILEYSEQIVSWHDHMILPGANWEKEIESNLGDADIILLLISPDFMDSYYCYGKEMQQALRRHEEGNAHVIPIIIRPVEWKETPIGILQALPHNGSAITSWRNRDEAFQDVAQGIQRVVNVLIESRKRESAQYRFAPPLCCPRCGSLAMDLQSDSRFFWCNDCRSDVGWMDYEGRFFALSDTDNTAELIR